MDVLSRVVWRSTFGKPAPKDFEFKFTPLWQMSALDKATIAKSNTETIAGAHDGGLISLSGAMKELRQTSDETGLFSNITDEEIKEAEELDAEGPPMPGEGDEPVPGEAPKVEPPDDMKTDEPKKTGDAKSRARLLDRLMGKGHRGTA